MAVMDVIKAKMPTDWTVVLAKLPPVVNIIMVLLVAQSLAVLTWKLIPSPVLPVAPADLGTAPVSSHVPSSQTVARYEIANWHLFGDASVVPLAPEAPEMIPEDAPDTRLSLTLLGVIAGGDLNAWAIISDRSGNEETYGIDSPVPGGAVLKEIFADRVILLHNGRLETLRLPQDMVDTGSMEPRQAPSRASSSRSFDSSANTSGGAITRLGDQATQVVKEYKQALMSDPQSVMDAVRAEPYRQGGQLMGYRVFPGRDKQLMGRVGLLPGDVVTSVNGISLDSPLKGLEIMQQVQNATEVSVDVLRNGVTQTFLVPLN